MAWLTGWTYRKPITITNPGSIITNYQIQVTIDTASLIASSKMLSNCNDIRFTDTDGVTLLGYWIQSGCNTASTNIWTKIPSLPSGSYTVYMYYGNPSATNASDYFSTFNVLGSGSSGSLTVSSSNTIINTYTYLNGNVSSGTASISVNSGVGLSNGDEILIIQMQNYSGGTAGVYEFKHILSGGGTTTLTLDSHLSNSYTSGVFNTQNASITQVVRVPHYTNVVINSGASITASTWNGYKGGIVIFRASGDITGSGTIVATGDGYRGGAGTSGGGPAQQGESYKGLGVSSNSPNLGGGSGSQNGSDGSTGSYGTQGGTDGAPASLTYGSADLSVVHLGSGGGGTQNSAPRTGGAGGGIVMIFANSMAPTVYCNGTVYTSDFSLSGSGGSVYVTARSISATTNAIGVASNSYGWVSGNGRIRWSYNSASGSSNPAAYTTGFDTTHNRTYASPIPTFILGTEQGAITLNISSSPSGGEIWIAFPSGSNWVDQLVQTPATIYPITGTGYYDVSIGLGGYQLWTLYNQYYQVDQIYNIIATLVPQPGTLAIYSTPSGAEIYVNGTDTGLTTVPSGTTISEIPGTYSIRLVLSGYFDWTATGISVTSNTVTNVNATFAGTANITSVPSGAVVYLDGNLASIGNTPLTVTNLTSPSYGAAQIHTYILKLSGYVDTSGSFNAVAGSIITVPATFPGSIYISSLPEGAQIYIDGVLQ